MRSRNALVAGLLCFQLLAPSMACAGTTARVFIKCFTGAWFNIQLTQNGHVIETKTVQLKNTWGYFDFYNVSGCGLVAEAWKTDGPRGSHTWPARCTGVTPSELPCTNFPPYAWQLGCLAFDINGNPIPW